MRVCDRKSLERFLNKELEEEDRLAFLYHLDDCPICWEWVYSAEKAKHPQYYKKPPKKSPALEKELARQVRASENQDEISEVA